MRIINRLAGDLPRAPVEHLVEEGKGEDDETDSAEHKDRVALHVRHNQVGVVVLRHIFFFNLKHRAYFYSDNN